MSYASPIPITQSAILRPRMLLNGQWNYIIDPYETGYRNHRNWRPFDDQDHPLDRTFFEDRQPGQPRDRVEYDFRAGPKMSIPGDWNHQVETIRYYEGSVWFQRDFDYARSAGNRVFLRFEAVNYEADVYLNGKALGKHLGGFDPFEFEVTGAVREGSNSLIVRANNRREAHHVPGMATDWWNYGGITRDVYLFEVPAVFIRDYHLQLRPGEGHIVSGSVQLDGAKGPMMVRVAIPELNTTVEQFTDAEGRLDLRFPLAGLACWSPDNPKLYEVVFTCNDDEIRDRIGFRTIETRGPDILLNGEPIFLRGISIHEEVAAVPRRAHSKADAEQFFRCARELNCNFIRLAHYPHNEHMPRLADELGFLLWEEIPVYWGLDFSHPAVFASAESQLRSLILRDRNRAAVIVWSIANETPVSESRLDFLRRLKATVRELDPHRFVSAALDRSESDGRRRFSLDDPFVDECDLMCCNQYLGWYYGLPEDCAHVTWEIDPDKPFFASEFGADAKSGRHGDRKEVWTEEHQEWLIEEQLEMLAKIPNFRGCSPWVLMDFRTPRRNLVGVQDHWNLKGLLSADGKKKKAWHVLKRFYDKMEAIYAAEVETAKVVVSK